CRARQPDEVTLVDRACLNIESRKANRGACNEHKPRRPSEAAKRLQSPLERQDGRRDAERNDVSERVELHAEGAGRSRHPRDPAVQHVDDDRDADEGRRLFQLPSHRVDDAGVAAEHVGKRERAGKQVHAAAEPLLRSATTPPGLQDPDARLRALFVLFAHAFANLAITVTPPTTLSLIFTAIAALTG